MSQQNQISDEDKINRVRAIIYMNRAMLGEISPVLRTIQISWSEDLISTYFYYDGEISDRDEDSARCIGTEIISDFPDYQFEENVLRLDYPQEIPMNGEVVYKRYEKNQKKDLLPFFIGKNEKMRKDIIKQNRQHLLKILSLNHALQGEVFPALKEVFVEEKTHLLKIFFQCDDIISDFERELIEHIKMKVSKDFPDSEVQAIIGDASLLKVIPESAHSVFLRRDD